MSGPTSLRGCVVAGALLLCFIALSTSQASPPTKPFVSPDGNLLLPPSIDALDRASVFRFAILSDHKGLAPASSTLMKNAVAQIAQLDAAFVIGLGDHLKRGGSNPFLPFISKDPFWSRHFYPNIADGENDYYGSGQDDWGAGRKLLSHLNMADWPEVRLRDNGCEYYARIIVAPYVVHVLQLHYPDSPPDPAKAFREDSRAYLVNTLARIDKKPGRDIVVVAAHTGDWLQNLGPTRRNAVLKKADLVLGATIHRFIKYSHGDAGPLVVNTGSVGFAGKTLGNYDGWLSIHVLPDPLALVVQYQDANQLRLQITARRFGYLKIIAGKIHPLRFRPN